MNYRQLAEEIDKEMFKMMNMSSIITDISKIEPISVKIKYIPTVFKKEKE